MSIGVGINRLHFPVHALGPGRRIGIWLQGCSIRCEGCMSLDTWAPSRRLVPLADVLTRVEAWLHAADGVTISGGEPFDQPEALHALLVALRARGCGSILVYSGHAFERLQESHAATLPLIDVLITEPFDAAHTGPALLRGSSNQRVHRLTDTGHELWRVAEKAEGRAPAIDMILAEDGELWLAGIPRLGDIARLSAGLARSGVRARTSAGRLGGKS